VIAGLIAAFVLATAVVVVVVRALAAVPPVFDEVCIEDECFRVATHERPVGMFADGTEVVELVCRHHGTFPREYV
jgi:hypothetical protein